MPVSKVFMICNAYESGVGHGFKMDGLPNHYNPDTDESEAYNLGHKQGIESRMEKLKCSICKNKDAVNESVHNPGTYYCSSCANYVCIEYGAHHLKNLPLITQNKKKS